MTKKKWGLVLISFFIFGFNGNDMVELEGYFNARDGVDFRTTANNVKFVLPPKTKGRILEHKILPSKNIAIHMEVADGPKKGEKVWVYYKPSNPSMKLFKGEEVGKDETKNPAEAKSAETTREVPALKVPDKKSKDLAQPTAQEVFRKIELSNKAVQKADPEDCDDCTITKKFLRPNGKEPKKEVPAPKSENKDLAKKAAPVKEVPPKVVAAKPVEAPKFTVNPIQDRPGVVGGIERTANPFPLDLIWGGGGDGWIEGRRGRGGPIEGFKISNTGPNKIVQTPGEPGGKTSRRDWEFFKVGSARQDLSFTVRDSYANSESAGRESVFMVFPRDTLPHVRALGDKVIVTLPNRETVTYDKKTQEIIGGVFSEKGSMKSATTPQVQYQGSGIVVRVDSSGSADPRDSKTATISKQGKTCQVPTSDLWPKQSVKHFKYFSDKDFDGYVRSKCGFGMSN